MSALGNLGQQDEIFRQVADVLPQLLGQRRQLAHGLADRLCCRQTARMLLQPIHTEQIRTDGRQSAVSA